MGAPRLQPHGTVNMTSHHKMDGALACYGYGEDDRAINPGDMLIVGSNWLRENSKIIETEFCLRIRGRDIAYFIAHAIEAGHLWDDNKVWLNAPSSRIIGVDPPLDFRSTSTRRNDDGRSVVAAYKRLNP
jgi:hypothetical protein